MTTSQNVHISFPAESHDLLVRAEEIGAWFRHRNETIAALLSRHPFDGAFNEIGAGNGAVSLYLQNLGYKTVAIEPLSTGAENCRRRAIEIVHCSTLEGLKLPSESISAIGAFDVLEHLERPEIQLREAHRVLCPGGMFFATVPAHWFLWSEYDRVAGHFRRYSKRSFRKLFETSGFVPVECGFFMNLLVLPAFFQRVVPELFGLGKGPAETIVEANRLLEENMVLDCVLRIEKHLRLNNVLPFGTSLFGAFRRN